MKHPDELPVVLPVLVVALETELTVLVEPVLAVDPVEELRLEGPPVVAAERELPVTPLVERAL